MINEGSKDILLIKSFEDPRFVAKLLYEILCKNYPSDKNIISHENILSAYDEAINKSADLHDALDRLSRALGEHSSNFDKVLPTEYKSAEEFIKALRSK